MTAAAVVAIVAIIAIAVDSDDGTVDAPAPVETTLAGPTWTFTPAPLPDDYEPRLGFDVEATVTPVQDTRLVEFASGAIQPPNTTFMEEATVTPGLTVNEPQVRYFWRTLDEVVADWRITPDYPSVVRTEVGATTAYQATAAGYQEFLSEKLLPELPANTAYMSEIPLASVSATQAYEATANEYVEFLGQRYLDSLVEPDMNLPDPVAL